MKKQISITISLLFFSIRVFGQIEEPPHGLLPGGDFKKDTAGYYKSAPLDSGRIAFISPTTGIYKLLDKNYKLIAEGEYTHVCVDCFGRSGKWTEYYDYNKIKSTGYYYENNPIGLWQYYYPNGQLEETYSYALIETDSSSNYCMVGSYQYYYENGQLKINGFYKSAVDTTTIEESTVDEITGNLKTKNFIIRMPVSKKLGNWTYYKQNGELERKEEFRKE